MDNAKNDIYYTTKIIEDMEHIIKYTKNLSQNEIEQDAVLLDSIMFRLIQISENSTKLSEAFKKHNNEIPWFAIKGLRNRIVHDYGNVDYTIIYETIKDEIPQCLKMIKNI